MRTQKKIVIEELKSEAKKLRVGEEDKFMAKDWKYVIKYYYKFDEDTETNLPGDSDYELEACIEKQALVKISKSFNLALQIS